MEPMIRGYSVQQQLNFLQTQFEPEESQRLLLGIPEDVRAGLEQVNSVEWYPRAYSIAVLRAIASHSGDDPEAAQADLKRCGTFIATEATNTFLKLLMKILTPKLFFKKIPEFWKRDQRGGHFEVDISRANEGKSTLMLCDVDGFDHIGGLSLGWLSYGLVAMGKKNVEISQTGWTLENPGPQEVRFDVSWT